TRRSSDLVCRKFLTSLCKRFIIKVYMISLTNEGGKGMKKFNLFLVLVLSLVFVLAACGPDRPESLEEGDSAGGGEDPEAGNEPEKSESLSVWLDGENQVSKYGEIVDR